MRLFVAVNLPVEERAAMWRAAAPLREAELPVRWVPETGLHITMKFLGEVSEESASRVGAALSDAVRDVRPFEVGIGGFGAFPNLERPRVVWCGVEHHPALELLANDVERALHPFNFTSELQPFRPHVTLGRARKDAQPRTLRRLAKGLDHLDYAGLIPVHSVDLMQSTRGPGGSVYDVRHAAPLAGAAGAAGAMDGGGGR
jgi:2'-5' RNA ligase